MKYTKEVIKDAIKKHIAKEFLHDPAETTFEDDYPLVQSGVIDSLGIFTLIGFLEKEFGIKVEPGDVVMSNFETVNAIHALVMERL